MEKIINITPDFAMLEAHDHKVAVDALPNASLLYLIRLGFTTAMNNCTAGMVKALTDEGLTQSDIAAALAAERADKFAQICGGSLRVGGGGVRLTEESRYVRDKVLAVAKARLAALKVPVPDKLTDLVKAAALVIADDERQTIEADARAAFAAESLAVKEAAHVDADSELAQKLRAMFGGNADQGKAKAKGKGK